MSEYSNKKKNNLKKLNKEPPKCKKLRMKHIRMFQKRYIIVSSVISQNIKTTHTFEYCSAIKIFQCINIFFSHVVGDNLDKTLTSALGNYIQECLETECVRKTETHRNKMKE